MNLAGDEEGQRRDVKKMEDEFTPPVFDPALGRCHKVFCRYGFIEQFQGAGLAVVIGLSPKYDIGGTYESQQSGKSCATAPSGEQAEVDFREADLGAT